MKKSLISYLLCWIGVHYSYGAATDGIVPDGLTTTDVVSILGQPIQVNIADPNPAGTSYNSYVHFNVPSEGAIFQNDITVNPNLTSSAQLIINEVSSANHSEIMGNMTVSGSPAHLIIANPNGITVNGSEVSNIGSLILTTGHSTNNLNIGGLLDQIQIDTNQGRIEIGNNGLYGVMDSLNILSKELLITGNIENQNVSPSAEINIITGDSSVLTGRGILPGLSGNYISTSNLINSGAINNAFILNLDSLGGITASKISVLITDQGAGVHLNKGAISSSSNFDISAGGNIIFAGTNISSDKTTIKAANLLLKDSTDNVHYQINSSKDLNIQVDDVFSQIDAGSISVEKNFYLTASDWSLDSSTGHHEIDVYGYLLGDLTHDINLKNFRINVGRESLITAESLSFNTDNLIQSSWQSTGVNINLANDFKNNGALIKSLSDFSLTSNGFVQEKTNSNIPYLLSVGQFDLNIYDNLTNKASIIESNGNLNVNTNNLLNQYINENNAVIKSDSQLIINANGDIFNNNSLIEGSGIEISANNVFNNYSLAGSPNKAIIFNTSVNMPLSITADHNIENHAGRILSNEKLQLTAENIKNYVLQDSSGINTINNAQRSVTKNFLGFKITRKVNSLEQIFPNLITKGELPYLVSNDDMDLIAMNSIVNEGGEIIVNNGNFNVNTLDFLNKTLRVGYTIFSENCKFLCTASANSNISLYGGNISIGGDLNLLANHVITDGNIIAQNNINIDANQIDINTIPVYTASNGYSGLRWWDKGANIYQLDKGGYLIAGQNININSANAVNNAGGILSALNINANNGINMTRNRVISTPVLKELGLFRNFLNFVGIKI